MIHFPQEDLDVGMNNLHELLSYGDRLSERGNLNFGLDSKLEKDSKGNYTLAILQHQEIMDLEAQGLTDEQIDAKYHRYQLNASDLRLIQKAGLAGVPNGIASTSGLREAYNMVRQKAAADYKMADYVSQSNDNSIVNMGNYQYGGGRENGFRFHATPHRPTSMDVHPRFGGPHPDGHPQIHRPEPFPSHRPIVYETPEELYTHIVADINGYGNRKPGEIGAAGAIPVAHPEKKAEDPLKDVSKAEVKEEKKPEEKVIPLNYVSVGLNQQHWDAVLSSHGIKIDSRKKIADPDDPTGKKEIDNPNYRHMVVESSGTEFKREYDLTQQEFDTIRSVALKGKDKKAPLQPQVDAINKVIGKDFNDKVTYAMMQSDQKIDIKLKPELQSQLEAEQKAKQPKETVIVDPRLQQEQQNIDDINRRLSGRVDSANVVYAKDIDNEIADTGKRVNASVAGMWVEKVSADDRRDDIRTALLQGVDGKIDSKEFASKVELVKDVDPRLLTFDKDKGKTDFVSLDPVKEAGQQNWDAILSSHGIHLDKENNKIELTTAGGGHFIDQRNTFTVDPEIIKTITSSDNNISEQKRLDALNSVVANRVDGGKVTREMLREDKNVNVLAENYQPERFKQNDAAYRINSQTEITTKANDQLKDWKDQHPGATEQEVNHQRGIIEKEVRDNVYARDYGYKEAPKVGMSNKDMKDYANRVADAMIVREVANNPQKYGDLTDRQLKRATEPLREQYYEKALDTARKYQDNSDSYKLTAVVNGKEVTANLTEKQYNAYVNGDTATRMKIMDKALEEVKIKGPHIPWQVKAQMFSQILNTAIGTAIDAGHGYYAVRDAWREHHPEREEPHPERTPMFHKDFGDVHWDSGHVERAFDMAMRNAEPDPGIHHRV